MPHYAFMVAMLDERWATDVCWYPGSANEVADRLIVKGLGKSQLGSEIQVFRYSLRRQNGRLSREVFGTPVDSFDEVEPCGHSQPDSRSVRKVPRCEKTETGVRPGAHGSFDVIEESIGEYYVVLDDYVMCSFV